MEKLPVKISFCVICGKTVNCYSLYHIKKTCSEECCLERAKRKYLWRECPECKLFNKVSYNHSGFCIGCQSENVRRKREQKQDEKIAEAERLAKQEAELNAAKKEKYFESFNFENEHEFHEWFNIHYFLFGITKIIKSDKFFPDVLAKMSNRLKVRIEIEYHASNYARHNHPSWGCDLIISYVKNREQKAIKGIPILSIFSVTGHNPGSTTFDVNSRQFTDEFKELFIRQELVLFKALSSVNVFSVQQ